MPIPEDSSPDNRQGGFDIETALTLQPISDLSGSAVLVTHNKTLDDIEQVL